MIPAASGLSEEGLRVRTFWGWDCRGYLFRLQWESWSASIAGPHSDHQRASACVHARSVLRTREVQSSQSLRL